MDADTRFRIMSMTKMVATVAALQLMEQSKRDIDAPVEEYCPEFAQVQVLERVEGGMPVLRVPASRATVKHLITRTSGLGYWFWNSGVGNGTSPDGVQVLSAATVDAAFTNQIGDLNFPAEIRTADPASSFGLSVGPGYKWGYGLLLDTHEPGRRRAGTGAWAGLANTHYWVDRSAGIRARSTRSSFPSSRRRPCSCTPSSRPPCARRCKRTRHLRTGLAGQVRSWPVPLCVLIGLLVRRLARLVGRRAHRGEVPASRAALSERVG